MLFLTIQFVALVIGFVLARQITGAVHDLFTGTEHLRNRDFTHQIPVRARDQLGELADSFNVMTGEITKLIARERREGADGAGDARGARDPAEAAAVRAAERAGPRHHGVLRTGARGGGRLLTTSCTVSDTKLGVLIADVSGKGLPAGLYMAQLKVLVQSLARTHPSPREFLKAVNRVVADNIDSKSFITMSYAVIDLERREMVYARAGHCPLIRVPGSAPAGLRKAEMLAPDGLVLGLKIDDGEMFDAMIQEETLPLATDDLLVFFTDGISETMNEAFDCYGEPRLAQGAGTVRAPAVRAAALVHLRRPARVCRRRRSARRHDDDHDEGRGPAGDADTVAVLSMPDLTVIFRTASNIEASVVQALLDSHGIESVRTSGPPASLFPFTVNPMGETRVSVREDEAEEAVRIIESHREQVGSGLVVPLPQQFAALEAAPRLSLPRSRAARARADAQIESARRSERRRHRQRVARVPRRCGARPGDRRRALPRVSAIRRKGRSRRSRRCWSRRRRWRSWRNDCSSAST